MDRVSTSSTVSYTGSHPIRDNSSEVVAGGAAGTAAFTAIRNSSKIANSTIGLVNKSKVIHASKKAKIAKILGNSKWMNNPVVKKFAGVFASFAAMSTVVGSAAKVADTCQYLESQRTLTNA